MLSAGGPKYVAGATFFDPAVKGQPAHWKNGRLNYYVDQGPLNNFVDNDAATAMVDQAAALWNAVPTAGVLLVRSGSLNEDVSGANVVADDHSFAQPSDVAPGATNYPLAIIFDADGAVLDTVFGAGTSDPTNCQELRRHGVDRPLQPRCDHRPRGDGAQRTVRNRPQPALDDAVPAGAGVRADSRARLRADSTPTPSSMGIRTAQPAGPSCSR